MRRYSLEQFKSLTEHILGAATSWLLGAPVIGECNVPVGNTLSSIGRTDWKSIIEAEVLTNAIQLPSSKSMSLTTKNCSHFLGIWGAKIDANVAFATENVPVFLEPWKYIDSLKVENRNLLQTIERTEKASPVGAKPLD